MKLKNVITEILENIVQGNEKVNQILYSFIQDIKSNGLKISGDLDEKSNIITSLIVSSTIDYEIELIIEYKIIKNGKYYPSDIKNSIAPYSECTKWNMYLKNATIFNEEGEIIYNGVEYCEPFFQTLYEEIHSYFDDMVCEKDINIF